MLAFALMVKRSLGSGRAFGLLLLTLLATACATRAPEIPAPFAILFIDGGTGRPVPLVEVRTTNGIRLYSDNEGYVAFQEPELMDRPVYFTVRSDGYHLPVDDADADPAAITPLTAPGATLTVALERTQPAERLQRLTGQGRTRHREIATGVPGAAGPPGGVMGQDTTMAVRHGDVVRWFWGDTLAADGPLGNFGTASATTPWPVSVETGITFDYAVDAAGFTRPMFEDGDGAVWVHGVTTVADATGRERIAAHYARHRTLVRTTEQGIALFDDAGERFEPVRVLARNEIRHPAGQAFRQAVDGTDYIYFATPFPRLRVRARLADLLDPMTYESYTCIGADGAVERDGAGHAVWRWRRGAAPLGPSAEAGLIAAGRLDAADAHWQPVDAESGEAIVLHAGSVRWNPYRSRFVMIANRAGAPDSNLGDVYYAESRTPEGPWQRAVRIATHTHYAFYNPVQHDFLDEAGGRVIFFEGTYSHTFSTTEEPVPRYDYNQLLYRLDLSDPRLAPAHVPDRPERIRTM
jgi:hypothetical protein